MTSVLDGLSCSRRDAHHQACTSATHVAHGCTDIGDCHWSQRLFVICMVFVFEAMLVRNSGYAFRLQSTKWCPQVKSANFFSFIYNLFIVIQTIFVITGDLPSSITRKTQWLSNLTVSSPFHHIHKRRRWFLHHHKADFPARNSRCATRHPPGLPSTILR